MGDVMDLQNIKTFILASKLLNFTKVAEELNYAQSTITIQIQRLEKELGFPLFERIGKNIYMTDGGRAFLPHAESIVHSMQKSSEIGHDIKNMKASIRVGILESLLFARFPSVLSKLKNEFPNLEIIVKIGQTVELHELLKNDKIDILYVSSSLNTDTNIKCLYQKEEELVFVGRKKHPLANKTASYAEIFDYSFIVTETSGYCFGRLSKLASTYECVLNHCITLDSVLGICMLLCKNDNLAFLPKYALEKEVNKEELVQIKTSEKEQKYYSQLLCNKDKWISPFIEKLVSLIKETFPQN